MTNALNFKKSLKYYKDHVSSGKVKVFERYSMPIIMNEREGIYFTDMKTGRQLINCHSNGGVYNLGHRNKEVIEALISATNTYDIGNHHLISSQRAALGKQLTDLMPNGLNYCVFGVSGGESVDAAIKLAKGFTKKQKLISVLGGYHGHTGLALATGDKEYRDPFGENLPNYVQVAFNDIEALYHEMDDSVAAVLLETIPATLGMPLASQNYFKQVKELCHQNGALLIIDEVQTGLGRTGKLWGFEHYDVVPDIVVLGKGLSGGIYPMTAMIYHQRLNSFFNEHPFIHISTFGGSELGLAVTQKVLELTTQSTFLDHVNNMSAIFKSGLEKLVQKHPKYLKGFRQLGLMMGLEFHNEDYGLLFTKAAYDCGLFCLYANNDKKISQMLPPLIIEEYQVKEVLERVDKAIPLIKKYSLLLNIKNFFSR